MENHIIKLSKLLPLFASVLLLCCSCERETDEVPGIVPDDPAMITLSVSAAHDYPVTRVGEGGAEGIESIYVLQFYGSNYYPGKNRLLRHVEKGVKNPSSPEKFSVTLQKSAVDSDDKYLLVVFANISDAMGELLKGQIGKEYENVQRVMKSTELTEKLSFDASNRMPMFGVAGNGQAVRVDESVTISTIQLLRAVSRVDIGVGVFTPSPDGSAGGTWNNAPSGMEVKFRLTDVQIWRAGKQYAYLPSSGNYSYNIDGYPTMILPYPVGGVFDGTDAQNWKYTGGEITGSASGTANYCENKIFLPEMKMIILSGTGDRNDVYGPNFTNRMAIIVGGNYNGSPTKTWYRIDFTNKPTNTDDAKIDMDIMRNSLYRFSIKRVESAGFESAEKAYNSKPVGITFGFSVTGWRNGVTEGKPNVIVGNNIVYGGLNGATKTGSIKQKIGEVVTDVNVTVKKIEKIWPGIFQKHLAWENSYNGFTLTGESNNYYGRFTPTIYNGEPYPTVAAALSVEGVYTHLMVAGEDLTDEEGSENIEWKKTTTYTKEFLARKLCEGYEFQGYSDWRLPRLSELVFIYLNQGGFSAIGGNFISLNGEYWSNSEYVEQGTVIQDTPGTKVWTLKVEQATGTVTAIAQDKSQKRRVRCVREVEN